ncbi:recombinase family protein [Microbacterium lacticum]|uniref:recombinase family protein n=1 Tax=Microbacterium lacticum TaxID=33885 RepID=UPI0023EF108A|nr:recombinase family protein [Microbacterium lacticum]
MYARIKAAVAKGETERASARQKRNKQRRREDGLRHGGTPSYGYRAEAGQLVPDPAEVERIHEVARRMLDDRESMHSIVTDWNNRGIQTRRGNHWRQANLRTIMLNRVMLGETVLGTPAQWEPVIDQRTFDRMHALLTDPSRKVTHSPGVKGGKYSMGGGLTVCGACGKPLITHGKQSPNGKTATLACLARVHGPSDKHPRVLRTRGGKESWEDTGRVSIVHDALEEVVWDDLIAKLRETPRFIQRMSEQDPEVDDRLDALEQERRDLRARKERAEEMRLDGDLSRERFRETVEKIDARLDALGAEYDSLLRLPISMSDFDPEAGIDWRSWTAGRRRAALRGFIRRIEVGPYPAGARRTRPRFKNETIDAYETAKWDILKQSAAARIRIVWMWES